MVFMQDYPKSNARTWLIHNLLCCTGSRGDRNSSFGSGDRGGSFGGSRDRDSFHQDFRDGGFGGSRSNGRDRDNGRDRFGAYGGNNGSGGSRSGNTSRYADERFERAPRSSRPVSGGAMEDPFNGYGNGLTNYNDRRSSPREWGSSSGNAGAGFSGNSNNKYANSKAKYESFDFEADDFDAIDVARRADSFRKSI